MLEKLNECKGGILLFLVLLIMFNLYTNRIHELNLLDETNQVTIYEK